MGDLPAMPSVHLLGPVELECDGTPVDLGGPQQRAVIAHLALEAPRVVSAERLIDRLWGDAPPGAPLATLQSYVSRLRRAIEPDRSAGTPARILVSEAPGYALRLPPERIDVHQFETLLATARAATAAGRHDDALASLDAALALWRGPALGGIGDDLVRSIVGRLDEERNGAVDDRFDALLALGRHAEAVPALQAAVEEEPLRERRAALLSLALYRSGRQVDALRVLTRVRSTLLDELGLDPGPELRELERRILDHDASLASRPRTGSAAAVRPASPSDPESVPVGRAAEWATLSSALSDASTGHGHMVLVAGEPGIGKSTLCEAFLRYAAGHGWRTATGRCVEAGLAPTLWPCLEVVRSMLAADAADPSRRTGGSDGDAPAGSGRDTALLRALVEGDQNVAAASPVQMAEQFVALVDELGDPPWLVLLDDLHWADHATLRLLALVLERVERRPLLIIGAHRPPELAPGSLLGSALGGFGRAAPVTRVDVSPFDADDVAQLIERTTGSRPTAAVASKVQARAGGNPLFVTEIARLAGERGVTDDSEVPDAIRDVVRARLRQLPPSCAAELEVAAVLGERFDLRTAMATSERDPDDCLDALDAAIVTRILVPDGDGFRFAHALVRDAVLAELSPVRRARLHHRAAEALLSLRGDHPDVAEPIAHHRFAAAPVSDVVTLARAALRASDVARWRGAFDAADQLAQRALAALDGGARVPESVSVEVEALEALVSTARRRGDPSAVAAVTDRIEAIAERSGSDAARGLVAFLRWGDVDEVADLDEVAPWVDRAAQLAAVTSDGYATVVTRYVLGATEFLCGNIDVARLHLDVAIDAAGAADPDVRPTHVPLAMVPQIASWAAALAGDAQKAREHGYRRAASWMAQRNEVDPTGSLALTSYCALLEALLDEPTRVHERLAALPDASPSAYVAYERAICDLLGAWAAARSGVSSAERVVAAMDQLDASEQVILRSCLRTFAGDALLAADEPGAIRMLAAADGEAARRGEWFWRPETLRLQAIADARFGAGERAAGLLAEAETLALRQGAELLLDRIRATHDQLTPAPT